MKDKEGNKDIRRIEESNKKRLREKERYDEKQRREKRKRVIYK